MATLEVSTSPPTKAQLDSITSYLGGGYSANKLVDGAKGVEDAIKLLESDSSKLKVPFLVDWEGGRVALNKDTIEHLLEEIRKAT
jgi:arsenate reductase-like glutaredoxin family protein